MSKKVPKNNMFNSPAMQAAVKGLSDEDRVKYQNMGKHMFSNNFDQTKVGLSNDPTTEDSLFYINEALKAGLDPMDLRAEEVTILHQVYGKKYTKESDYTPFIHTQS